MKKIYIHNWNWVRRSLLVFIVCFAVLILVRAAQLTLFHYSSQSVSCPRCNIVILDIDILRADALRCDDKNNTFTPNLCRLIRLGTTFTHAYSQSYWTLPSTVSTYASLYPNVHNMWIEQSGVLAPSIGTLATTLEHDGYSTYYSGQDNDALLTSRNGGLRGYSHMDLSDRSQSNWLSVMRKVDKTGQPALFHAYTQWLHFPYLLVPGEFPIRNMPKPKGLPVYQEEFNEVFGKYLVSHISEVFTDKTISENPDIFQSDLPVRSEKIARYFQTLDDQNDHTKRKTAWPAVFAAYMQSFNSTSSSDVAYLHMLYESKVHTLDTNLADFIDYLLQPDVAKHTIVVITSSHGEAFGEHGTFMHVSANPYNELYHVPFIIKYPNGVRKNIEGVVENIDLFPTLIEMVAGKKPNNLQGISLVPLFTGVSLQAKSYAISMNDTYTYVIQDRRYAIVIDRNTRRKPELYDLIKDPGQQYNIAVKYSDIYQRYMRMFMKIRVAPEYFLPRTLNPLPSDVNINNVIRSGYF